LLGKNIFNTFSHILSCLRYNLSVWER